MSIRSSLRPLKRKLLERLPPPADEGLEMSANRLRERMRQMPPLPSGEMTEWDRFRSRLRTGCAENDPRFFTQWSVIQETMFVGRQSWVRLELQALKRSPSWKSQWKTALTEDRIGSPERSAFRLTSSGNRIHHAYSLLQFEKVTGLRIADLPCVVEFGGGYGNLCRLLHKLGFKGRYIIFDFPEFLALQEYYLASLGIPYRMETDEANADGVVGVSTISSLHRLLTGIESGCLIGLWSLSESPLVLRSEILAAASQFTYNLFAVQEAFEGVDNLAFARTVINQRKDLDWNLEEIPHLPKNHYLIGKPSKL